MGKNDDEAPDSGPERDYEVGYGRPPVHSRFGKGNRAGRGRPKGARNVRTLFNEVFAKRKKVKLEGREMKLSRGEIAMEQLANRAAAGDPKAIAQYLAYADKWTDPEEPSGLTPSRHFPLRRLRRNGKRPMLSGRKPSRQVPPMKRDVRIG